MAPSLNVTRTEYDGVTIESSCGPDFFGAGTFWSATLFVVHPLADLECLDATSFDLAVVEEQVPPFSLDEPKTLVREDFLDRPLRHNRHS